jgi:hypothetical protein
MKKLLPFLFICLLFHSCEKEYCWRCEVTSTISGKLISTQEYCGLTEKEIEKIEYEFPTESVYTKKCIRYMK